MVQRTARGSNRYLVELTAPEAGWKDVDRLIRRARDATGDARFLRAIFVPEDSSFLLLYEAASPQAARTAARALAFDVDRVSEVTSTGEEQMAAVAGKREPE